MVEFHEHHFVYKTLIVMVCKLRAARAGGGVYIACEHLPMSCRDQMSKTIGLPISSGSSVQAQFALNNSLTVAILLSLSES